MEISEHAEALEEVKGLITQTKSDSETSRKRLTEIEGQMPRLLAGEAFGDVTAGEVEQVRSEIRELRRFINESPWLLAGLAEIKAERQKALDDLRKTENRAKAEQLYDERRKQFEDHCRAGKVDRHVESDFRQISHSLGRADQDRRFIKEMICVRDRVRPDGN